MTEKYRRHYVKGLYPEAAKAASRACSILEEEYGKSSTDLARCLNDLGAVVHRQAHYRKAESLYRRALAIREKARNPDHLDISRNLYSLAKLYKDQGDYEKAESLYHRSLAVGEEAPDPKNHHIATVLDSLAVLYQDLGSYRKSELLHDRALAIRKETLPTDHPDVANSLNNLAALYRAQGNNRKAEPLLKRTLDIREKALGPEHPDIATILNNLAVIHHEQGDYGQAESLLDRALDIREKALGPEHPDIAITLINLASLNQDQGHYEKAKPLFERALAIGEISPDRNHLLVAQSLNNLAEFYKNQGQYKKAEPLLERALVIRKKKFGNGHPFVAQSLNNLARLYHAQGNYEKAKRLLQQALAVEIILGPEHPTVATILNNLAALYRSEGDYQKAEQLYERALAIYENTSGSEHPHVAASLSNLARLYHAQGAYGMAEPLLERALAIQEESFGPEHPHIATSLNNLGALHQAQGAYAKAESSFERALAIQKALGPNATQVVPSLNNLAMLYQEQGDYGKVEPLLQRTLAIAEKMLGPDHPTAALILSNLATLYQEQGDYDKAKQLYERALAILEKALGTEHPTVAQTLSNLATLYEAQSGFDHALPLLRRSFDIEDTNLTRSITVTGESRRLAFARAFAGSLRYALSLHLRVAPRNRAVADLALTTLLRRKNRVQDLVAQSNATLRHSLSHDDIHLINDLADIDARIAVLSNRGPRRHGVEAYAEQLDKLYEQRDRLWSELAEHSALVENLKHPITIGEVQKVLHAGSCLIEFVQYVPHHDEAGTRLRKHEPNPPPRYASYLVFPDRDFTWVDLGPAAPIDEHIEAFRQALQTRQAIPTELYEEIIRPIAAKLSSSTDRLILAPAGVLSIIPFGALSNGKQYLVEQYDLRYVTTARELLPPPATPPVTTTSVTIVANPTGDEVPGANFEADVLASLFPKAHVLLDNEATETNVRTIERPLILHLATHGFFSQARNEHDNPMFLSGLYLADTSEVEVDPDVDDGQLTAYEVSGMDLRGTQLVVMSACETGLGEIDSSEGVFGLRRAFANGGARTTVMSLWEISGPATQYLMEAYYRKLAEGMGRGEAMQAVQLEMLRSEEHRHPKDWAAFIVSGDDTPMVFPEGEEPQVEKPQGPPDNETGGGCATRSPARRAPMGSMLIGLLGVTGVRRRRR